MLVDGVLTLREGASPGPALAESPSRLLRCRRGGGLAAVGIRVALFRSKPKVQMSDRRLPLLVMRDIDKRFPGRARVIVVGTLEVAAGRDHGAGRSERRGQIDADQGPDRRPYPFATAAKILLDGQSIDFASPQEAQARRHQHHLSGNQSRSVSIGRREHLSRRPASPPRRGRPAPMTSRDAAELLRFAVQPDVEGSSWTFQHRDQQMVEIARAFVQGAPPPPG